MEFNSRVGVENVIQFNGYHKLQNGIHKPSENGINSKETYNGFRTSDLEDQFKAACDAIQNLPKNGPYQPSNEILLKFYGYYKQASSGRCKKGRPSMFNVVERAKWDAWNSVSDLSKEEAMQGYVNEIKNIIETMPHDKYVQKLTEILEPYEYLEETQPQNELKEQKILMNSDSDLAKKDEQILTSLKLPLNVKTNWNQWANGNSSTNEIIMNKRNVNIDFIPLTNENLTKINSKTSNGNSVTDSSPSYAEKNTSFVSDDEEDYCDTSDIINENFQIRNIKKELSSMDINCNGVIETSDSKDLTNLIQKCGGERNTTQISVPNSASNFSGQNQYRQSRPGSSMSMGNRSVGGNAGGAGGFPPNINYNLDINPDTNRQILLILLRLQQDTNNVITRLSYLEATVLSLQNNLQMNRIESSIQLNNGNGPKMSAFTQFNSHSEIQSNMFGLLFKFLKSIDWKTVAIAFVWPFVIRLAFYVLKKLRFLIKSKRFLKR